MTSYPTACCDSLIGCFFYRMDILGKSRCSLHMFTLRDFKVSFRLKNIIIKSVFYAHNKHKTPINKVPVKSLFNDTQMHFSCVSFLESIISNPKQHLRIHWVLHHSENSRRPLYWKKQKTSCNRQYPHQELRALIWLIICTVCKIITDIEGVRVWARQVVRGFGGECGQP